VLSQTEGEKSISMMEKVVEKEGVPVGSRSIHSFPEDLKLWLMRVLKKGP